MFKKTDVWDTPWAVQENELVREDKKNRRKAKLLVVGGSLVALGAAVATGFYVANNIEETPED